MPTWSGWEDEFLTAARIVSTAADRRFLDDWAAHAQTDCGNNPIDLSWDLGQQSSDCADIGRSTKAQRYTTHGNAAQAFNQELHSGDYAHLLEALRKGNPYTVSDTGLVSQELSAWGSQKFAQRYFGETANAPGRGGGGGIRAPHTLGGWKDLRHSVNVLLPATLRQSNRYTVRALQSLARARKVRL